jgi:hypothetical protein
MHTIFWILITGDNIKNKTRMPRLILIIKVTKIFILNILSFLLFISSLYGQTSIDTNDIHIIPRQGSIEFVYKGSLLVNDGQIVNVLKTSDDSNVLKYVKKYKRKNTFAGIIGGVGLGFVGIWLINESFNSDFHSANIDDRLWKQIVVGTSLTFSFSGLLLNRSAKKQLILGIEEFNNHK